MKTTKWVDFGQDVTIEFSMEDIRGALDEAFAATEDKNAWETPNAYHVQRAINSVAQFFNAMTDKHIASLSPEAREIVHAYLLKASERFREDPVESPSVSQDSKV